MGEPSVDAQVLPCTPNPYAAEAWSYEASDTARAAELCGLLAGREAGDLAWLRRAVLSTGGDESVLSPEVEALPPLWEWVVAQLDEQLSVVPSGWHGEWKDDGEARGDTPDFVPVTFLGQAVVFHLARLHRTVRPDLRWAPYRPRMGARDRWFLTPTLANAETQLFPPVGLAFAMSRASRWMEPDESARARVRAPEFLRQRFEEMTKADPLPRAGRPRRGVQKTVGNQRGLVAPAGTSDKNPREVYLYRARRILDGVDPARCAPVDPVRVVAGLQDMGFEEVEHQVPLEPEGGMLLSEWTLDRPDGTAVAYALVYASPAGRLRKGAVRKMDVRIETEADEGMSPTERARGSWWHAGVLARLRELAADVGARVVSREELGALWDDLD